MQATTTAPVDGGRNTGLWIAATAIFVCLLIRSGGLYPCILADETVHSKATRLVPMWEAEIPAYLYALIYRICNLAGDDYPSCARVLNTLFFVSSMPFLFWTARRFCSRAVAATIAVVSLLGPVNTFTAYFMPESMYFFGFWVLAWLTTRLDGRAGISGWGTVGVALGFLALIKPHAMFSVPAFVLYAVCVSREGGAGWLWRALRNVITLVAAVFATKMAVGYQCAGQAGLHPFGKLYGGIASHTSTRTDMFTRMAAMASENTLGHLVALCVSCGVALAITVAMGAKSLAAKQPRPPAERFALFACLVLGNVVALASVYTASQSSQTQQPEWENARIHMRYYEFVLPALFMVVASQVGPSVTNVGKTVRIVLAASIGAAIVHALATNFAPWITNYHDDPEVRGLIRNSTVFWLACSGSLAILATWAFAARTGAAAFVFCWLPIANVVSSYHVSQDVEPLRHATPYDRGGLFARQYLSQEERSKLIVVGSSPAGVYRALFHIDNAHANFVEIPEGGRPDFATLPAGTEWVLFVGSGWQSPKGVFAVAMEGFVLCRTSPDLVVDFRRTRWLGLLSAFDGLSEPVAFGRWSIGKTVTIEFLQPLPEKFAVGLRAAAFVNNDGKEFVARVGSSVARFTLSRSQEDRLLEFDNPDGLRTLTIEVPAPISPKELGTGPDERVFGFGLVALAIYPK